MSTTNDSRPRSDERIEIPAFSTEILFTLVALFGVLFLLVLLDLRWTKQAMAEREADRDRLLSQFEVRLDRIEGARDRQEGEVTGGEREVSRRLRSIAKRVEDLEAIKEVTWTTLRDDHEQLEKGLQDLKMLQAEVSGLQAEMGRRSGPR
ncbi:MAG: hypothetical protein QF752_00625 [Planctomycetota bacterium]|jgi:hypothetical protein|nr:hypothetical protein [Planctomycetota bacterium]